MVTNTECDERSLHDRICSIEQVIDGVKTTLEDRRKENNGRFQHLEDMVGEILKEISHGNRGKGVYEAEVLAAKIQSWAVTCNPRLHSWLHAMVCGGDISGLAIYDTMQYIRSPINTICLGQAASMGSLLLAAGAKGERRALPNATIMIHQPSGGYSGQAKDISIHTKQIIRVWDSLNELYAKHTGQTIEVIQKNMDRDYFMTPEEAKEFGIIDEVIDQRPMALVADAVGDEGKDKGSK
ncbi:hypothetical protein RHSIM_Rhsim04G0166700 [Rhododendron simsii]|uniref:ATP-dependent Clp protease proteolytic subunit n=1 Tax=Rhododendron simsii TaxID=118357 RepID=A0A834H6V6_RHOSS|nr:hypothetical protein RHSIM_Rhsim04G0166700 [Rhododendron simsii]